MEVLVACSYQSTVGHATLGQKERRTGCTISVPGAEGRAARTAMAVMASIRRRTMRLSSGLKPRRGRRSCGSSALLRPSTAVQAVAALLLLEGAAHRRMRQLALHLRCARRRSRLAAAWLPADPVHPLLQGSSAAAPGRPCSAAASVQPLLAAALGLVVLSAPSGNALTALLGCRAEEKAP